MQTGLITLDVVAKINGINIDLRSVVREYALTTDEIKIEELLRIIKQFDLRQGLKIFFPMKY